MATNIFNYNGTKLTTVPDGRIDTTSASIKFPGYGYINYGEAVNENMLWIMQNFSGPNQPTNPTIGQTWYDTASVSLKVYNGTSWVDASGVSQSTTPPASPAGPGALWFDTVNKQLRVYSGTSWLLVGPLGSANNTDPVDPAIPTYSMIDAARISDGVTTHPVWRLSLSGILLAIVSVDTEFTPIPNIDGFATIKPGLNFNSTISGVSISGDLSIFRNNQDNVPNANSAYDLGTNSIRFKNIYADKFYGVATNAESAISATSSQNSNSLGGVDAVRFLRTDQTNLPDINLEYDLGNTYRQWRTVYAGNIVVNGTPLSASNIVGISGTPDQVIVTGTSTPVLSLPQSIGTSNSVRFSALGLNNSPGPVGSITFGDGTSQNTAGTSQKTSSGYQKLPSGVIIQWGEGVTNGNPNLVTLPIPFTTATYKVTVTEASASGWNPGPYYGPSIYGTYNRTTTNFELYGVKWSGSFWGSGALAYSWIAVGY